MYSKKGETDGALVFTSHACRAFLAVGKSGRGWLSFSAVFVAQGGLAFGCQGSAKLEPVFNQEKKMTQLEGFASGASADVFR